MIILLPGLELYSYPSIPLVGAHQS